RTLAVAQSAGASLARANQAPATDAAGTTKLNDRLGSDGFANREKATKELGTIGVPAPDAVGEAAPHVKAPTIRRAEEAQERRSSEEADVRTDLEAKASIKREEYEQVLNQLRDRELNRRKAALEGALAIIRELIDARRRLSEL